MNVAVFVFLVQLASAQPSCGATCQVYRQTFCPSRGRMALLQEAQSWRRAAAKSHTKTFQGCPCNCMSGEGSLFPVTMSPDIVAALYPEQTTPMPETPPPPPPTPPPPPPTPPAPPNMAPLPKLPPLADEFMPTVGPFTPPPSAEGDGPATYMPPCSKKKHCNCPSTSLTLLCNRNSR
mmetsp:Transcript_36860/g.80570  ORF Transcript_36860/g.80570 Transcript_36860/m.80570 type:complete len:178 (+) Transcript_36860:135-668(+)